VSRGNPKNTGQSAAPTSYVQNHQGFLRLRFSTNGLLVPGSIAVIPPGFRGRVGRARESRSYRKWTERRAPLVAVRLGDICNFGQPPGNRLVTGRD
jgi:hypothetical protein